MDRAVLRLLREQDGVVGRAQLLATGLTPSDVRRLLRRHELAVLHAGVYLDHTGAPSWAQSAWGAVLACGPAVLSGQSALRAVEGPSSGRPESPIEVAVDWERRVRPPLGVRPTRRRRIDDLALWDASPPRIRYDDAVLDVAAAAASELGVIDEVSRAVQGRRTTAERLQARLETRERLPRRSLLSEILADVAAGTCSVLERGYLTRVERPHGLPVGQRQVRDRVGTGVVYRDVEYDVGLVVELDGRAHHDNARARDRDFDRDLETAVSGRRTVRLSFGQVFDRACWTADRLGRLLTAQGWSGPVTRCARCP